MTVLELNDPHEYCCGVHVRILLVEAKTRTAARQLATDLVIDSFSSP